MAHIEHPTPQADFMGWLGLGLIALAVIFALVMLAAGMTAA